MKVFVVISVIVLAMVFSSGCRFSLQNFSPSISSIPDEVSAKKIIVETLNSVPFGNAIFDVSVNSAKVSFKVSATNGYYHIMYPKSFLFKNVSTKLYKHRAGYFCVGIYLPERTRSYNTFFCSSREEAEAFINAVEYMKSIQH